MSARLIRLSSRATGQRRFVRVWIYDTVDEMREAGERFNGTDLRNAAGVTQSYQVLTVDADGNTHAKQSLLVIRMWRGQLGAEILTHEVNHAATAIYGSTLTPDVKAIDVLDNANETLAYLQSDLTGRLVDRLYALGYYDRT